MKGLDLNSIKDKKIIMMTMEESLKDIEPFFTEDEIKWFWENKRRKDLEREISIHKDRWCKFNCRRSGLKATLFDEDGYFKDKEDMCKLCQIDAFIRDLIDQKVFT